MDEGSTGKGTARFWLNYTNEGTSITSRENIHLKYSEIVSLIKRHTLSNLTHCNHLQLSVRYLENILQFFTSIPSRRSRLRNNRKIFNVKTQLDCLAIIIKESRNLKHLGFSYQRMPSLDAYRKYVDNILSLCHCYHKRLTPINKHWSTWKNSLFK